jgi:UDP-2-acetamido-2,6-beta-L-arabino-hexul-4-ose reductase
VATFCYNIARDFPIQVNDPNTLLRLVYIDDVLHEFISALEGKAIRENGFYIIPTVHTVTLQTIVDLLVSFKESRTNLSVPNMQSGFEKALYATYLSFLPEDGFSYKLKMKADQRGSFTEIIRTTERGQFSVNISKPGVTKGNHWHHTKNEKFVVVQGEAIIRFRKIGTEEVIEYEVSGNVMEVVDIPPGYTHNITNIGEGKLVTFMWANEPFDPDNPDTIYEEV